MKKIPPLGALMMPLLAYMAYPMQAQANEKRRSPISFSDDKCQVIHKGHRQFNINGKIVWALNYRNAIRKASKI